MGSDRLRDMVTALLVAVALLLLLLPVHANHLDHLGSDFTGHREASCGVPVFALLGTDPDVPEADRIGSDGTSLHIGRETAATACVAAAGRRVSGALVLLLVASVTWFGLMRRSDHLRDTI